jgi:quinol monooxygenase YgiN
VVRLAVALVAPASGTDQLLHALRLLASPTRIEPGCLACRVWTDDGNRSMVRYVEEWASGVPLDLAVQRIDPTASNPHVQANAAGFRAGVVQITVKEYDIVVSLRDRARGVAD